MIDRVLFKYDSEKIYQSSENGENSQESRFLMPSNFKKIEYCLLKTTLTILALTSYY